MQKVRLYAIFNFIFFVVAFLISSLSQSESIFPKTISEVSAKYEAVITPAGFTFSIWSIIYIALFGFTIYHLIQAIRKNEQHESNIDVNAIHILFVINNIATALWVYAWVNEMLIVSVILMIIQLLTLIFMNINAHTSNPERSWQTRLFTQFPLSIYFAWICMATIVNISAVLLAYGWRGGGISEAYWAIILIGIATLITLFMVLVRRNVLFGLVILWALYGIIEKRRSIDEYLYRDVILAAWAAFFIIIIAQLIRLYKSYQAGKTKLPLPEDL